MTNPILKRPTYQIEIEPIWSFDEGKVGIEIGDVQDSFEKDELPIHLTCSVREFWIPIPDTCLEVNVRIDGIDISLKLDGAAYVANSQIGRDTNPYICEINVDETINEDRKQHSSLGYDASVEMTSKAVPTLAVRAKKSKDVDSTQTRQIKTVTKAIKTRVSYIPNGYWHVRSQEINSSEFYFSGTILSDIVCKICGFTDTAVVQALLSVGPENIHSTQIRDSTTSDIIDQRMLPADYVDLNGNRSISLGNLKRTILALMLEKSNNGRKNIILSHHKLRYRKSA